MEHMQSAGTGRPMEHKYSQAWSPVGQALTPQLFSSCRVGITPMDAMLMSFQSSTATQHSNFIAYSGPPAAKNSNKTHTRGTRHMREEGPLVRLSSHEDVGGHRSRVGAEACDTPIVVRGRFESPTNVASASADGCHEVEDRATAGIDGGDLFARFLGSPCDFREWSSLDVDLRFQAGQTSIESTSANAAVSVDALDSTEAQVVASGEVRGDMPVGDRNQEFTAATDLLAMDTCPDRGTCAGFSATHATAESPLCPSSDVVPPSQRNRGERQLFCGVDDDAMQIVEREEQPGPESPQDAPEVDDTFRHIVQFDSSARQGQEDLWPDSSVRLGDEPSDRGHSPTRSHSAPGNHMEVGSSDDEIRPWKPRRRRRSIGCIPRGIPETGCPQQQSRLSCASNVTSRHQRAAAPKDFQSDLRPGCPADVEEHACPAELQESIGPSTPGGSEKSLGLGSSPDNQPQTGLERPGRRDVTRDDCSSCEESQHPRFKQEPHRGHNRSKVLPRVRRTNSVARPHRSASSISRTPRTRARKQTRQGASLEAASSVKDQPCSSPVYDIDGPTWAIEKIISSRRKNGKTLYKVKWKPTWEPAESLRGTADRAIAEFHRGKSC